MTRPSASGLIGFVLSLLLYSPAEAQMAASALAPEKAEADSSRSHEEELPGFKSGSTAFWWSFLGTAVPCVVSGVAMYAHDPNNSASMVGAEVAMIGGLLIGPSLGHFYAARPGRAFVGLGIRTLGIVGLTVAGAEMLSEGPHDMATSTAEILGVTCGVVAALDVFWDIGRASRSAEDHNRELRRAPMSFEIAPHLGSSGPGLCARVAF
jgi:hypothetical protein